MTAHNDPVARWCVVGAGAWGTALAVHLHRAGHQVTLWTRDPRAAMELAARRENRRYLPSVALAPSLGVTADIATALQGAGRVVLAVPAQHARAVLQTMTPHFDRRAQLVLTAKGIEIGTLALPDAVAGAALPGVALAVLSGPSFAAEVAAGHPTAVVVAAHDEALACELQHEMSHGTFRVYANGDPIGVQLAGALKNVVAIAAGVTAGLGLGANTLAALITRALAEMRRLGVAAGGRSETFDGLAGLGDLVLTCTGTLSRNRTFGERLGRGESPRTALGESPQVVEGVTTTRSARELAVRYGVELPIVEQVHAVLEGARTPAAAIQELLARPLRREGPL